MAKHTVKILEEKDGVDIFITEDDTHFLVYDEAGGGDFRFKLQVKGTNIIPYLTLTKEVFNSLKDTFKTL